MIACLVACGDEAIVIEVDTAAAPTETVELFVGTGACDEPACEAGIQPPGTASKLAGKIYFRDGAKRFTSNVDAQGVARFRLEPSDLGDEVRFLLAVGAPTGTATGAVLVKPIDPASGPLRVKAALTPVAQFDPANPVATEDGVQIWSDAGGVSTCVMFQRVKDGGEIDRQFVVPDADRDCDAIDPDRCDEYIPDASTKPTSLADARCGIVDNTQSYCQLGGFQCSDRTGGMGACAPMPYCVDLAACGCAGESQDAMAGCLDAKFAPGTNLARLVCTYNVQRSTDPNDPTHVDLCGEQPGRLAALPFPTGATGVCDVQLAKSALGSFAATQEILQDDHQLVVGVDVLEPDVCKISVRATGNMTADPANLAPIVFALKVEATQPTARAAILPVEIRFVESGTECLEPVPEPCHFETPDASDGVFRCQ